MKKLTFLLSTLVLLVGCQENENENFNNADFNVSESALSETVIAVPAEGGNWNVAVYAAEQLSLTEPQEEATVKSQFDTFYSSYSPSDIMLHSSISSNKLSIKVGKAQFAGKTRQAVPLYNKQGRVQARVIIEQDGGSGNAPVITLGEGGKQIAQSIASSIGDEFRKVVQVEGQVLRNPDQVVSPNDNTLFACWNRQNTAVAYSLQAEYFDANHKALFQHYFQAHRALSYYLLTAYFGDVPYFDKAPNYLANDYLADLARSKKSAVIENLASRLESSLDLFSTQPSAEDDIANFFLTRAQARTILAKLYLENGDYKKAAQAIKTAIEEGGYSLDGDTQILTIKLGAQLGGTITPATCLDLRDLLLDLAECQQLTGDANSATENIQKVASAGGITLTQSDNLLAIAQLRQELELPYLLPFLRRNDLGTAVLGLPDTQLYRLLLPIPQPIIKDHQNITQNPGY